jgi:hypothetical protein
VARYPRPRTPRPPPRRALGPDPVLAVRAGDNVYEPAALDVERGVVDAPSSGVELVEHSGDLVALVILQGEPLPRCPSSGPALAPRPVRDDCVSGPRSDPWPTRYASAMMAEGPFKSGGLPHA